MLNKIRNESHWLFFALKLLKIMVLNVLKFQTIVVCHKKAKTNRADQDQTAYEKQSDQGLSDKHVVSSSPDNHHCI